MAMVTIEDLVEIWETDWITEIKDPADVQKTTTETEIDKVDDLNTQGLKNPGPIKKGQKIQRRTKKGTCVYKDW